MTVLPDSYRGPGVRVRFASVKGATQAGLLAQPLYLPCFLGDFAFTETFGHQDYDTVSAGSFSVPWAGPPTARQLRTSTIETLTIDWHAYARFLSNPKLSEQDARNAILAIARSRTPVELLIAARLGGADELRMNVTLRQVVRTLKAGEADPRYYSIDVKEWRDNSLQRRAAGAGRTTLPTTATLTAETTLTSLARTFYPGVAIATGWRAIARANGVTNWGASTPLAQSKRWRVGDKVKIPVKP